MEQYITRTGTTQCPTVETHTPQLMQEYPAFNELVARTVHIPWLVDVYDTLKSKRWLNSNPQTTMQKKIKTYFIIIICIF